MSTKDYITTLLDMEDIVLKNIEENAQEITIELELAQKVQLCPTCGAATNRVHDITIGRYGIWICGASGRRFTTDAGATSAPNAERSSPRNAASPGVISVSPIG